jgi:predicted acetyltransferase
MHTQLEIGPPRPEECDSLYALLCQALHLPTERVRGWASQLGGENFRAARLDGQLVAGLGIIWMGQWFGGAAVPMAGITLVGVAPPWRGTGVGQALLRAALADIHAAGVPLSALYPATLAFYQQVGYDRAGHYIGYELPLAAIDVREHGGSLLPIADEADIYNLYATHARRNAGSLERPAWMWQNKLKLAPNGMAYCVVYDGQAEGYVVLGAGERDAPLTVQDYRVLTPRAGRRILTLLASFRTMLHHVTWHGGPFDPLCYLLREPALGGGHGPARITDRLDWLLRIVDVPGALTARGYPPGVQATLHLELHDEVLPTNSGRYLVHITDGRCQVEHGGTGSIRLGVRELAALYSGCMSPAELRTIGAIEGDSADLALLGAVFAGPRPWLADMF